MNFALSRWSRPVVIIFNSNNTIHSRILPILKWNIMLLSDSFFIILISNEVSNAYMVNE